MCDILRPEIGDGTVRITDWIKEEPKLIMEACGVVCSVNHEGADSFYEAVWCMLLSLLLFSFDGKLYF